MNIQRQYSLPNCQLVVEGLSQGVADASGRPPISVVTHVECRVAGQDRPLVGGRDLLESLVNAVSEYAQEYLSGIAHPAAHLHHQSNSELVRLQKIDTNLHRLTVQPVINNPKGKDKSRMYQSPETPAAQMDLTTVQLFDLVEAVDQFFADAQTLPELALKLNPLSKRFATSQEPLGRQALPAALGLSGLAVAALALFYVPNPPNRRPTPTTSTPTVAISPGASPSPNASPSSVATSPSASPEGSPESSPESSESRPSPESSSASPSPTSTASTSSPELEDLLKNSREITDPDKLNQLVGQLQDKLYEGWNAKPLQTFKSNLEYRVGVAENGDIVGFKFVNDAALTYVKETPLLDLRYNPTGTKTQEAIAQFFVVFKPDGVLEISSWHGSLDKSKPSPSP